MTLIQSYLRTNLCSDKSVRYISTLQFHDTVLYTLMKASLMPRFLTLQKKKKIQQGNNVKIFAQHLPIRKFFILF